MSDAGTPVEDIVHLTRQLVQTPSRAWEDDPAFILNRIDEWSQSRGLEFQKIYNGENHVVGGFFHLNSGKPGKTICLNACIDTCGYGDESTWNTPPSSAEIIDGVMYGRGVADSKVAASMFCHLFESVCKTGLEAGELYVLVDADEHTGNFGGIKSFLNMIAENGKNIDYAFIGYPGNEEIMIGARGFLRAELDVHGVSAHSGSRSPAKENALLKAATLISMISESALPAEHSDNFPFGPKATMTAIKGGNGFSQVPDKVSINIDMRLTPSFNREAAEKWLQNIVTAFDLQQASANTTTISYKESWPCYALAADNPAVSHLKKYADELLPQNTKLSVSGPSNIGNLLAQYDIPAICGFGVIGKNVHAANESIKLDSIQPAFKIYLNTVKSLCPS